MPGQSCIAVIAGQLVVGGAERQLYLWLSNLDRSRFSPVVVTLHPGHEDYWEHKIEELGIPLYRVHESPNSFGRLIKIINFLKPHHPDLIHGWHLFVSPYAGMAARWFKCVSLSGFRGSTKVFRESRFFGPLSLRLTDAMLVNSNTTANDLKKRFPTRANRIFVAQNAVLDEYEGRFMAREQLAKRFGLDPDLPWICSMGRMDPDKRFDLLLEVISRLQDIPFEFILVGDGPERQGLEALSTSLELTKNVIFTGEIPNAARLLKGMDIFAFASFDEGLPNVIMEAQAAGLPIVTWKLPFFEELITNGQTGLLVKPGDVDAMTDALRKLLKDPLLRQNIGTSARASVLASFGLDKYIQKMTAVYESLLNSRHR